MNKTKSKIYKLKESPFNSKLFFDLEATSNDTDTNESESDNSFDLEELEIKNNNNYFLLNDLIKEMDSSCYEKEENTKNFLNESYENKNNIYQSQYLINDIYYPYYNSSNEYYPFGFMFNNNEINRELKNETNIKKGKTFHERRGDWFCFLCGNLNFSFRTKCNRCKTSKHESVKKLNEL